MKTLVQVVTVLLICLLANPNVWSQRCPPNPNIQDSTLLIAFDEDVSDAEIFALQEKYHVRPQDVESLRCLPRFYRWKLRSLNGHLNLFSVRESERPKSKTYTDLNSPIQLSDNHSVGMPSNIFQYSSCTVQNRYSSIIRTGVPKEYWVYVLDSGIDGDPSGGRFNLDSRHKTFFGNYLSTGSNGEYGFDLISPRFSPDSIGHGTHVAGIIASTMQLNNIPSRIVPIKVFSQGGTSDLWTICKGIDEALCDGAKIINCSWGFENCDFGTLDLNKKDFLGKVMEVAGTRYGTVFIAAAGNAKSNLNTTTYRTCPAYYSSYLDNVVSVTSYCGTARSSFANYSIPTVQGEPYQVQIAADGDMINSTWINRMRLSGTWATASGTSQAAPFVAAAFAIVASKSAVFSGPGIKSAIFSNADRLSVNEWELDRVLNIPKAYRSYNTVIPLELTNFDVQTWQNDATLVTWETVSEKDITNFDIEQSADGKNWQIVGTMPSKGNSTKQAYNFIHTNANSLYPNTSLLYYRLKIIEKTGQFSYSSVKNIVFRKAQNQPFKIYPNPTNTEGVYFVLKNNPQSDLTVELVLMNMTGRTVLRTTQKGGSSESYLSFKDLNLPFGLYLLQAITPNGTRFQERIFIQNK